MIKVVARPATCDLSSAGMVDVRRFSRCADCHPDPHHGQFARRVDGGACRNNLLMQIQADILQVPVVRTAVTETTALGAAYLAGLAAGVYRSTGEISSQWRAERRFEPQVPADKAAAMRAR